MALMEGRTGLRSAVIAVPADGVPELEHQELAFRVPVLRGPVLDAVVTVGTDASVLVTLLQAPDAVRAFVAWVHGRFSRLAIFLSALQATRPPPR